MKGLTFIVSDKCNITCDFCAPDCGPKHRERLDSELMIRIFDELDQKIGVANVVFTGGEPTLFRKDIIAAIKHIRNLGDTPIRIVTNAFWGKNYSRAVSFLHELKDAGLSEFNYSVDDFHQKYIPMETIGNALAAALEVKIPVLVAFKTFPGSNLNKSSFDDLVGYPIPVFEEMSAEDRIDAPLMFSTGCTIPVGRGSDAVDHREWAEAMPEHPDWRGPCREVLKTITIQADGSLTPCCGLTERSIPVFYSGNAKRQSAVDMVRTANRSTLYNWLALEGPEGIMDYISRKAPHERFTGEYVQNCQLCQEIFSSRSKAKIVASGLDEKAAELSGKRAIVELLRPRPGDIESLT